MPQKTILDVIENKIARDTMTDEEYENFCVTKEMPSFIRAMDALRLEGVPMEEAFTRFRVMVVQMAQEDGDSDEDTAALLRVFDLSVARFRKSVERARDLVRWAYPEDGEPTFTIDKNDDGTISGIRAN